MEQKENEIKGKELFELSLTFTEGDEEKQFSVTMKAKKDGKELGSKLEDTLNNQLPQLFDDAMNLFRDQMRQYNKEKPEAPTNL